MSGKASTPTPPRGKVPAPATARTNHTTDATHAHAKHGAPPEDAIRSRAYALWEEAGHPDGDGVEFWLRAEKELAAR